MEKLQKSSELFQLIYFNKQLGELSKTFRSFQLLGKLHLIILNKKRKCLDSPSLPQLFIQLVCDLLLIAINTYAVQWKGNCYE